MNVHIGACSTICPVTCKSQIRTHMLCLALLLHFTPGLQTFKVLSTQRPAAHYLSWPGRQWQRQVPAARASSLIAGRLSCKGEKWYNCQKCAVLSPVERFCGGEEAGSTVIHPTVHLLAINIRKDPASQGECLGSRRRRARARPVVIQGQPGRNRNFLCGRKLI